MLKKGSTHTSSFPDTTYVKNDKKLQRLKIISGTTRQEAHTVSLGTVTLGW